MVRRRWPPGNAIRLEAACLGSCSRSVLEEFVQRPRTASAGPSDWATIANSSRWDVVSISTAQRLQSTSVGEVPTHAAGGPLLLREGQHMPATGERTDAFAIRGLSGDDG